MTDFKNNECPSRGYRLRKPELIARRPVPDGYELRKKNPSPYHPALTCQAQSCGKQAVEGYFFCSESCRDEFDR